MHWAESPKLAFSVTISSDRCHEWQQQRSLQAARATGQPQVQHFFWTWLQSRQNKISWNCPGLLAARAILPLHSSTDCRARVTWRWTLPSEALPSSAVRLAVTTWISFAACLDSVTSLWLVSCAFVSFVDKIAHYIKKELFLKGFRYVKRLLVSICK